VRVEPVDDGWAHTVVPAHADTSLEEGKDSLFGENDGDVALPPLETLVTPEHAKSIISRNDSPTFLSTNRSIRTEDVSMVVVTATRVPPTATSIFPRVSTSNKSYSTNKMQPRCSTKNCAAPGTSANRSRWARTPILTSHRAQVESRPPAAAPPAKRPGSSLRSARHRSVVTLM